jgi:hypothetical protein
MHPKHVFASSNVADPHMGHIFIATTPFTLVCQHAKPYSIACNHPRVIGRSPFQNERCAFQPRTPTWFDASKNAHDDSFSRDERHVDWKRHAERVDIVTWTQHQRRPEIRIAQKTAHATRKRARKHSLHPTAQRITTLVD